MSDTINLKFEFNGKRYTSDAKGWARLPDGTQLKVTATDGDGNATVEKNGKKNVPDGDVALASEVVPEPEAKTEPESKPEDAKPAEPTIADLKARWEAAAATIKTATAEREAVEPLIAVALVRLGEGKKEKPSIGLGGEIYKAQRSKSGGAPPRLVKLGSTGEIL
jgi:hypothetical protein